MIFWLRIWLQPAHGLKIGVKMELGPAKKNYTSSLSSILSNCFIVAPRKVTKTENNEYQDFCCDKPDHVVQVTGTGYQGNVG